MSDPVKDILFALRAEHDRLNATIETATKQREAIWAAAQVLAETDAQPPAPKPKAAVATPKNPKARIFVDDAVVADADRMMRAGSTWDAIQHQTGLSASLIARLQREGRVYKRKPGDAGARSYAAHQGAQA